MSRPRGFRLEDNPVNPLTPTPITVTTAVAEGQSIATIGNPTDNHLYFYENIDSGSAQRLVRELRSLDSHFQKERIERQIYDPRFPYPPIWLHIQSDGGEVFSSLAIADQIKSMAVPVYSIVEGSACSGATILSCACRKRYIYPNSFMMIHQVSAGNWGTYDEHMDEMKILGMIMKSLIRFYEKNSLLSKKKVSEMLKHDSWMSAKQAKKKGFVDFIIGEDTLDDTDYESELYRRRTVKGSKKNGK